MGKLHRVNLWLVAGSLCLGCSSKSAPVPVEPERAPHAAPAAAQVAVRDDRFDAAGQLLPSGQRASWLELPRGFHERPGSTAALAVYEAPDLPLAKVREYFAARLRAERVDYPSGGVTFHAATPTYTQLVLPPLEVRLLEVGARRAIRVWIEELPPPNAPALPVDVAAQELARMRKRVE